MRMSGPSPVRSQKLTVQHLLLRFKIYLKLQHSHLFPIIASNGFSKFHFKVKVSKSGAAPTLQLEPFLKD